MLPYWSCIYQYGFKFMLIKIWIDKGINIDIGLYISQQGFLDSSIGKESSCNAGDPSSIPGSGRSTGEGIR